MSQVDEQEDIDGVAFRWGKKRGVGGQKGVQFYESFTYDGIDYSLYDCVYLYKKGEPEPYIGKLVRIWAAPDNLKEVKIHWFFRPAEISNWLGDGKVLVNEVFLAAGEGVGLANVNPLGAIAGKCNVVCISRDPRNPQPSEEDIEGAHYLFYRTFDVGQCTISDKMDDHVGGLEVTHVFNKGRDSIIGSPSFNSGKDAGKISVESSAIVNVKDAPLGSGEKNVSGANANAADMPVNSGKRPNVSGDEANRNGARMLAPTTSERKVNTVQTKGFVRTENELKCAKNVNSEDRPSKKVRFQEVDAIGPANPMSKGKMTSTCHLPNRKESREETDEKQTKTNHAKSPKELARNFPAEGRSEGDMSSVSQKPTDIGNVKDAPLGSGHKNASGANANAADMPVKSGKRPNFSGDEANRNGERILAPTTSERKVNTVQVKGFVRTENELKCAKNVNSEDRPSKKIRFQEGDAIGSANPMSKGKMISTCHLPNRKESREETDEKLTKTNHAKSSKELARNFPAEGRSEGGMSLVSQKPMDERSRFFRTRPWEEKFEDEHKRGTIVLLMNLDPAYSSGEVEDIIWHAFKEHCSARMLQSTMISSPLSAQALVIMKSKEVAERIVKELNERCLMLSNGRPLVATILPSPSSAENQSTFVGHLTIDSKWLRRQRQKEVEAVSTSHCAQPNSIEFDMGLEWWLLQAQSERWWEDLYKQQAKELRNLKAKLKPFEQHK